MNNELTHWGIKGQKWGRRRYQNSDGSLTAAGRERYGTKANFEKQYPKDKAEAVAKATSNVKKGAKDVKDATDKVQNKMNDKAKAENKSKIKRDLSNMSDAELRDIVNRLNMEERYTQVMESRYAPSGKSNVEKILSYAGTIAAGTVTAIELYQKINELRGKK